MCPVWSAPEAKPCVDIGYGVPERCRADDDDAHRQVERGRVGWGVRAGGTGRLSVTAMKGEAPIGRTCGLFGLERLRRLEMLEDAVIDGVIHKPDLDVLVIPRRHSEQQTILQDLRKSQKSAHTVETQFVRRRPRHVQ